LYELRRKKRGTIGISTVTDPYQPIEEKYKLTRYCLKQLLDHDFPIHIQTKSSFVIRDIDIISKFSKAEVMISIATLNDKERKLLEPNSSSIKNRLDNLRSYSETGVKTSVFFGPLFPTIKIEDLNEILDIFIDCGVSEIMIDCFHLRKGIWKNIKTLLSMNPEILNIFFRELFTNKLNYYNNIKINLKEFSKEKKIKIIEAF
jgi:DNA repair photolyase